MEIARAEGLDALSIRRVASVVGASPMSLYRHVSGKDALVNLVAETITAYDLLPDGIEDEPWQRRLRLLAETIRRELAAYPGLVEALMIRSHHGPGALAMVELILRSLHDAGLEPPQAVDYYAVFLDLVFGRLHRELTGDPVIAHRDASLPVPHDPAGDLPHLRAAEPYLRAISKEQVFQTELDMFIDAVSALAARSADPRPPGE